MADLEDELRRDAIMADLAMTALGGMLRDGVLHRGFDPLDRDDVRTWFRRHGAHETTLTSAPIRALYDLCFAYRGGAVSWDNADFAAGAALMTVLRIALDYPDYVVYEMRAGMGEVVIAPIYQALVQQGVKFRFFHRATRLELATDAARWLRSTSTCRPRSRAVQTTGRPSPRLPRPGSRTARVLAERALLRPTRPGRAVARREPGSKRSGWSPSAS